MTAPRPATSSSELLKVSETVIPNMDVKRPSARVNWLFHHGFIQVKTYLSPLKFVVVRMPITGAALDATINESKPKHRSLNAISAFISHSATWDRQMPFGFFGGGVFPSLSLRILIFCLNEIKKQTMGRAHRHSEYRGCWPLQCCLESLASHPHLALTLLPFRQQQKDHIKSLHSF